MKSRYTMCALGWAVHVGSWDEFYSPLQKRENTGESFLY